MLTTIEIPDGSIGSGDISLIEISDSGHGMMFDNLREWYESFSTLITLIQQ